MAAVTDATAKQILKEIRRGLDLLEQLVVGPPREEREPAGAEFTFVAGPAFDKPMFRIKVTGPLNDSSRVILRQGGQEAQLATKRPTERSLIGEVKLSDLQEGPWEAVFEHEGKELFNEETELEA
jgi:hypothetical protein